MVITNPFHIVEVIVEAGKKLQPEKLWWRGQSVSTWKLIPGIYRPENKHLNEMHIAIEFQRKAKVRYYSDCPTNDGEWLLLMQHYGLPTRLLDWTESPLTALFFALWESEHDSEPAVLWALDPFKLNQYQLDQRILPMCNNKFIRPIAKSVFTGDQTDQESCKILAFAPPHRDLRVMIQNSYFTIHGVKTPLDQLQNSGRFLQDIKIPSDVKLRLRIILEILGIHRSSLFPDLEQLARELKSPIIAKELEAHA